MGMTDKPPTSTAATPTFGEMLEELLDLSTGIGVALLPLLLLSVPGIVLFVVLPAILLLALALPLAAIGAALAAPPYLVARWLRRRGTPGPSQPSHGQASDRRAGRPAAPRWQAGHRVRPGR